MTENILTDAERIEWFENNYSEVKEKIALACRESGRDVNDIILLAATKTVPVSVINHAINSGINFIGENRVQELLSKTDALDKTVHKHFIGTLQTNKIKYIINEVEMIESVPSVKAAEEIGRLAVKNGKTMDILLEINIGNEESKSGFLPAEAETAIKEVSKTPGVRIMGLMAIPPICDKKQDICEYFCKMEKMFIDISAKNIDNVSMVYLSMGMSDDYYEAIKCGANIVRVGTALFGRRNYNK